MVAERGQLDLENLRGPVKVEMIQTDEAPPDTEGIVLVVDYGGVDKSWYPS